MLHNMPEKQMPSLHYKKNNYLKTLYIVQFLVAMAKKI